MNSEVTKEVRWVSGVAVRKGLVRFFNPLVLHFAVYGCYLISHMIGRLSNIFPSDNFSVNTNNNPIPLLTRRGVLTIFNLSETHKQSERDMYTQVKRKPRKRTTRQGDELFFTCLVWGANAAIILGMVTAVIFS